MLNRQSQSQMTASRLKPRTLVPSSSPPLPSSSLLVPTSSAPPYTDEKSSIRRASTDSDCSIFSHFSLTPESEAGLRAWEQEMLATPSPSPASSGNHTKSARRWVVFKGRVPGIYDSADSARAQTDGIPGAVTLSYANSARAERDYVRFKADGTLPPFGSGPWVVYTGRSTGIFTDLGEVKAAVDGYPSSHFAACTSLQEATELYCLFQSLSPEDSQPGPESSQGSHQSPSRPPSASSGPNLASRPSTSGKERRHPRPFQQFSLDESISNLAGHECWWVTWAAVSPGVYFGIDSLLEAGPIPGGYRCAENQEEAFEFFHTLIESHLVRKLPASSA